MQPLALAVGHASPSGGSKTGRGPRRSRQGDSKRGVSEATVDLPAWADLDDVDQLRQAVDGEDDPQAADARAAIAGAAPERFRVTAEGIIHDLFDVIEDALTRRRRQPIHVALGRASNAELIGHPPRIGRRRSSSVT